VDTLDLLLHPVRLRIVHALSGGRTRTTSDLCARLPDVSKATVYRHVALLAGAGLLEVAGERRVRGAVERRYRLHRARAVIDPEAAAAMSLADHRHEFNAYLDRGHADPTADSVSYRQFPLWLNRDELAALVGEVRRAIVPRMANEPTPDRRPYLLSTILFPLEDLPQHRTDEPADPTG
jgi:DNA-binding transcriptional ArsR family regulator